YKGLDLANNKNVAIKILLSTDSGAPERAEREARILQTLRPHNIMWMRDHGNYDDRGLIRFFCVLPYFPGGITLDDIIAKEGAIKPLARALDLLCQIANGLKEAHASGVVHRDIKPANIMIHRDSVGHETAYITDFGIAAVGDNMAEAFERKLTAESHSLGSPQYASPQQLIGAGSDPGQEKIRKDDRNDVYSFGVTAFEIVTGGTPFPYEGKALDEFTYKKRIGKLRADSLGKSHPELPTELVMLVDRCMAYELLDRPRSAEVLSELNVIKLDQPSSQPDTPRTLGRVKTPGSTRVSGDAETMCAPSTPPGARRSDPKAVVVKSKTGGLHSRARTMLILMAVVASAIVGWALLSDKLEQRTIRVVGPMDSGSAMAMPAAASASVKELAAVSVTASASAKPKAKPLPGKPRVDWSPPATGEQPLDPGLPGPPM
ncbi:MAG: serine/threonine-protein kinase, partial [Patescibacteria group bacterium]